jgi:hypothetical protein
MSQSAALHAMTMVRPAAKDHHTPIRSASKCTPRNPKQRPQERRLRVGEHDGCRLAAGARMNDHGDTSHHDRKKSEGAGGKRADPMARGGDCGDDHRHRRRAQRKIVAGPLDSRGRRRAGAVARRQRDGQSEDERIKRERARRGPVDQLQDRRGGEPHQRRCRHAEHNAVTLREHCVNEREDCDGRVRGHAADGAAGDEGRRVFQRENDVGGAGGGGQRGDQRGDKRPAALGRDRRDDDDRRGHRHL